MVHLLVRFDGAEEKFSLSQDVITLGRVASNTIQVKDVKASRTHCELRRMDSGWKLVDLESSNGTSVNGKKVNTHLLVPGDVIAIGAFELVFEPVAAPESHVPAKKHAEPIEKTVADNVPAHKEAAPEAPAMAATAAASRRQLTALLTKGAIAAAVLIAGLIAFNQIRAAQNVRENQELAYKAAVKAASNGEYADAIDRLEKFLASKPEADLLKKATATLGEYRTTLAKRDADAEVKRKADLAELLAEQQRAGVGPRYDSAKAQVQAYLNTGDFAAAVDESKRFMMEFTVGEYHDRMAALLKNVLAQASNEWDAIVDKANGLVTAEKYAEAIRFLTASQDRFSGTRFAFDMTAKIRGIERLSGVTTAYASGAPEMSSAAQETMLAVNDLVKARQYDAALKSYDKMLSSLGEKEKAALTARRQDIAREAGIFKKLLATVNEGGLKDYDIPLGGNVVGHLAQATDVSVSIAFKDPVGHGDGTTGRKWIQVPGSEMLTWYRQLRLEASEILGLAAFCFDNRLPLDGADVLRDLIHDQSAMRDDAYGLISRVRQMGVPADGFEYFERGWYTKTEVRYAKLDYKAKKGAELAGKIDAKLADQGYAVYREMTGDTSLEADFRAKVAEYFKTALHEKRAGIMKGLEQSQNIASFKALQELKRELNRRRAAAIAIIYDKTIYPDENHGIIGQPKVDDAVKLVRDMWDKPLTFAVRLDDGVKTLVDAGEKVNAWLKEMGESGDDAQMEEYDLLLGHINESLNLKNVCLDKKEQALRDYNRKVMAYNKKNDDTQMVGVEVECAKITNEYREMMGRACLELDVMLGKCAKKHSQEMVDLAYFAHESPTGGMKTPSDRAAKEGYTGPVGENICTGYGDARAAYTAWYNSSGHHRNMLSDAWNHIGLGNVGGSMWTENLGRAVSHLGGKDSTTTSGGGGTGASSGKSKSPVREGVNGPKKPTAAGEDAKAGKPEDKSAAGKSPYKKPEGPCTGTTPYDGSGGGSAPPAPDDKGDKPGDK